MAERGGVDRQHRVGRRPRAVEPRIGIYNTTKAAVDPPDKMLATELAPAVRVNAIAPGLVKTDMARALWEPDEEAVGRHLRRAAR